VNVAGQFWRGREEIQRRHAFVHGTIPREDVPEARSDHHGIFRSSTSHFDRIDVRLLRPDLAVAHGACRRRLFMSSWPSLTAAPPLCQID
jgi:hypothetical protein